MIKAGSLTKGDFIRWKNEPVLVADKEFYNPGKGSAVVRLQLKSLVSGNVLREVLKTDDQVEEIDVQYRRLQYLYKSGDTFVFMDPRSYEQAEIDSEVIGDDKKFLQEGLEYKVSIWEGKVIAISLPKKMVFEVIKAQEAIKGDTVSGATKLVTISNGETIKVPLFIKQGDKIVINTETGDYVERKN